MDKKEAREVKINPTSELDDVIRDMIKARIRGINIYCEFNGQKIYSADVTYDSVYKELNPNYETMGDFKSAATLNKEKMFMNTHLAFNPDALIVPDLNSLKPSSPEQMETNSALLCQGTKSDVKCIIEDLIRARARGLNICSEHSGKHLYSKNVTFDSGFIEVTGMQKGEFLTAVTEEMERENISYNRPYKPNHILYQPEQPHSLRKIQQANINQHQDHEE